MWCDTARNPRLGPVDARVTVFILIWIVHMRMWTFKLVLAVIGVAAGLLWMGVSPQNLWGLIRMKIGGGALVMPKSARRALRRARL